ncbi:MAG: efflux RND transporter periplasmic adaptor subunit [Halieaceae bacterium]|jgi:RND family efflux transporter MFP subunit|nr:efflux RND transporter periplasmic adaptor subunit [Halieaceae bacterium]
MTALRPPPQLSGLVALGGAAALTAAITVFLHARVDATEARATRGAMPVATTTFTTEGSYLREQRFLGTIKAATRSDVGFEIPGLINEIEVTEGQSVRAGDVLARLDRRSLGARRAAALATREQVTAELELARARVERQMPLADSGAISAQSFDDTRLGERALAARLAAAQAELERIDVDLDKSVLRAPYDALIGRQYLDQGSVTLAGSPVFALIATGEREARIGVAVEQAADLKVGESYRLTLRGREVRGRLRAVRPDVNPLTLTTTAIFTLPRDVLAYDGEPVAISLPRRIDQRGAWLPLSALLEGDRGIWTVLALRKRDAGDVATREIVEVLHVSGDRAFVRGTLNSGDRIVSDGVHRVAPGTRVTPARSQQVAGA